MLVIVDYEVGNIGSILNMLKFLQIPAVASRDPETLRGASRLLLPGVGAFDAGVSLLRKHDLIGVLDECVRERRVPVLGICLGMQLLTRGSEEGVLPGLGWIDAECRRFTKDRDPKGAMKVPHMGWNVAKPTTTERGRFKDRVQETRFYFVHSYHARCVKPEDAAPVSHWSNRPIPRPDAPSPPCRLQYATSPRACAESCGTAPAHGCDYRRPSNL